MQATDAALLPWFHPAAEDDRIRAAATAARGRRHGTTRIRGGAAGRRREVARRDQGRGASLAAATAEKNKLTQERDAEKAAERAEKDKAKNAQKRQKVLTLCRDRNATAVGLVLLNDPINKRKDVQAALDRAGVKDAERIMQRAHRNGAALIDRFDSLNDTYAFEPAYDTYAKLNDRGLNVAFVPVPADDGDDERLEALAELRDMAEGMDVDIRRDGTRTDLTSRRPRRSSSAPCRW